jgi:hypothetical protein
METILQRAKDPAASPEELQKLSTHKDVHVRRAVAENPNTPPTTLSLLGAEFPREFLENSALPLVLLENPNLFEQIPRDTIERLLNKRELPSKLLEDFAKNEDYHVRARVARHPSTPPSSLAELAKSRSHHILRDLAENPNTPTESLSELAEYPDHLLQNRVRTNPNTSPETQWRLFSGALSWSMDASTVSAEWASLRQLASSSKKFEHQGLSTEQRDMLLKGGQLARHFAISDLDCPVEVLRSVALDPRGTYTTKETISLLLLHPKCTLELQQEIAELPEEHKRAALASHPQLSASLFWLLSQDKSDHVVACAARNPSAPLDCLEALRKNPNALIRAAVAQHPKASDEMLRSLMGDSITERAISSRPICPEDVWTRLAASSDKYILHNLAKNTHLPESIFTILFQHKQRASLLRTLISNVSVPLSLIEANKSEEKSFAEAAFSSSRIEIQKLIADFRDWRIRLLLAKSRHASPEVLERLTTDKTRSVQEAARKNPNAPKKARKNPKKAAPKTKK